MSIDKRKREVTVEVIQCDRDGCDETVAPQFEPMKGWLAIVAMEAVQRGGFQARPGSPEVSGYVCPGCAKAVAAAMRTSATLKREPRPPSWSCNNCGVSTELLGDALREFITAHQCQYVIRDRRLG